jgi:hypothetical protein
MLDGLQPALPFSDPLPVTLAPRPKKRKHALHPVLDAPLSPAQLRAMRQALMGLVRRWALSGEETLLLLGEPVEDAAAREQRLNALLGVGRSLLLLLPEHDSCLCYLRRPCRAFAGASLLQIMLTDGLSGIDRVREHLAQLAAQPGTLGPR